MSSDLDQNTGDEGLREAVLDAVEKVYDETYNLGQAADEIMTLIRQDRRELLALLLEQQKAAKIYYGAVGGTDVVMVVPVSVIDAELQHGAESGEA